MATIVAEETGVNLKRQLEKLFDASLKLVAPDELGVVEASVTKPKNQKYGDYQCDNAMKIGPLLKKMGHCQLCSDTKRIGQALVMNIPISEVVDSYSVTGPGYVNVVLSAEWMAKSIQNMLINGIDSWAPNLRVKRALVDFCSPNIAKEMHVGHLRSTILGDTLARMLEFSKVEVLRRSHIGDWGTQFGMLIEYLIEKLSGSDGVAVPAAIGDLQSLYRESKLEFDKDPAFKEKAQRAVVRLQGGDPVYQKIWAEIVETSRTECAKNVNRLQVEFEEKGESFYHPYIGNVIEELDNKGLVEESDGARVIFIEGIKSPLMLVKTDGGFNYSTTDVAALWYRLHEEKADWIIYVTDVSQHEHFDKLFRVAREAGWLPATDDETYPRVSHVGFGVVQGEDGKRIRSRETETIPLSSLLDEAKHRSKAALIKRGNDWIPEELDQTAEAVGYAALKYADLQNNRLRDYKFSFDRMLSDKGDTAVYHLYAHARICSIIKKSGKDIDELKKTGKLALDLVEERALGLHLLQFAETVEEACTTLLPHVLCEYLKVLSDLYTKFYSKCQVNGSAEETSRLLLCEATALVMRKCFHLLGITPVYKL